MNMNLNELRDRAYQCACDHGFHDTELSDELEEWRDIPGYEGLYQVSNLGRVRSLDRVISNKRGIYKRKGCLKSISNASYGYKGVGLCKNGIVKTWLLHILVAKAFLPNPEKKRTINHINCNKADNRLCNLEWATDSENIKHAFKNGKKPIKNQLGKLGFDSSRGIAVVQVGKITGRNISIFGSAREAHRETGVNATDILSCVHGKLKSAGGFIWKRYTGPKINTMSLGSRGMGRNIKKA